MRCPAWLPLACGSRAASTGRLPAPLPGPQLPARHCLRAASLTQHLPHNVVVLDLGPAGTARCREELSPWGCPASARAALSPWPTGRRYTHAPTMRPLTRSLGGRCPSRPSSCPLLLYPRTGNLNGAAGQARGWVEGGIGGQGRSPGGGRVAAAHCWLRRVCRPSPRLSHNPHRRFPSGSRPPLLWVRQVLAVCCFRLLPGLGPCPHLTFGAAERKCDGRSPRRHLRALFRVCFRAWATRKACSRADGRGARSLMTERQGGRAARL